MRGVAAFGVLGLWLATVSPVCAMSIFIAEAGQPTFTVEVAPTDTVSTVEQDISNKISVPVDEQILTFRGSVLSTVLTLSDYNIQKESTLNLSVTSDAPVPEPASIGVFALAIAALGVMRRWPRKPHMTQG